MALSSETADAGSFTARTRCSTGWQKIFILRSAPTLSTYPTDCPQRDERLGWMGDAQVYIRAATLTRTCRASSPNGWWMSRTASGRTANIPMVAPVNVAGDDGGPAWADAGVICPWTIYQVYGDTRMLERHYDSMARFIEFCRDRSTPDLLPPEQFHCFGDWLTSTTIRPSRSSAPPISPTAPRLMARIAEVLGKTNDAVKYNELFQRIKAAFNRAYVAADGQIEGDTQTDYVLALSFGLLDGRGKNRPRTTCWTTSRSARLASSTGFIGTKACMLALAQDRPQRRGLSADPQRHLSLWGFSIKHGATSIWERWDGWTPEKGFQDPGMNSFAHYSFGAVYQWMVENIGGIHSDGPAYKKIVIAPQPDDKSHLRRHHLRQHSRPD